MKMDTFVFTLFAFITETKLRKNIGMGWKERTLEVLLARNKKIKKDENLRACGLRVPKVAIFL